MKLSEVKSKLNGIDELRFKLPDGEYVASHFHVTEVGQINKSFIDCGGVIRNEKSVSFIDLSINKLGIEDSEVEVEYQGLTIQKFGLDFENGEFLLTSKQTDCLARDKCNVELPKVKVDLSNLAAENCCTPGGGCC